MDALLVIGSTMLAAVVVFFIWVLLSDVRALKRTSATRTNEMATGSTAEQPGGSEADYGSADCFYDCMRAFHWEAKEESPCASACGLKG